MLMEQVVMMGRYGRLGLLKRPSRSDYDAVNRLHSFVRPVKDAKAH